MKTDHLEYGEYMLHLNDGRRCVGRFGGYPYPHVDSFKVPVYDEDRFVYIRADEVKEAYALCTNTR